MVSLRAFLVSKALTEITLGAFETPKALNGTTKAPNETQIGAFEHPNALTETSEGAFAGSKTVSEHTKAPSESVKALFSGHFPLRERWCWSVRPVWGVGACRVGCWRGVR